MSSPHPLDPASAQEYLAGRDIMTAAGLLPEGDRAPVRFAYYGLEEAAKDEVLAGPVLAGTGPDRRLRAFLVNTDSGESSDVVVSLTHGKVVSARTLDPAGHGQMPILESDFARVDEITKADPDWRAAMARRGYHDLSKIRTAPITAGAFGPAEDDRRRMVRVLAFVQDSEHDLAWAHPIDGVAAYVDLIEKKVFKVTDEFELPVPRESGDYDDEAVPGQPRTIPNAICIHEEDSGIWWKHTDIFNGSAQSRRQRRLVVSYFTTVGNYDYGFYWYFYLDGTIELEVKATGVLFTSAYPGPDSEGTDHA